MLTDSGPAESDVAGPPVPAPEELPALVEALLFVSDGPTESGTLARVLNVSRRRVERALEEVAASLEGRGVRLQAGPEGVQLITAPEAGRYIEHFLGLETGRRLSTAALETLAIVAYRQPVTRAGMEAIRGVNCDAAIATLRARGLVEVAGRAPGPGRPALFVATQRFLEHFGLERANDLPSLDELAGPMPLPGATLPLPPEGAAAGTNGGTSSDLTDLTAPTASTRPLRSPAGVPRPDRDRRRAAATRATGTSGTSLPRGGLPRGGGGLPAVRVGLPPASPGALPAVATLPLPPPPPG